VKGFGKKIVTLALQGGGSHGAFTWGVLDRLLENSQIKIEGISGASAGAMNAVVLAHGFTAGGPDGARQALKDFWESVGSQNAPAFKPILSLTRFFSPYQLNPFDLNPLRDVLKKQVDFERLRAKCKIKLFVAATEVSTGMAKLFRTRELTIDAVLASACLPSLHHAIEIDGEAYWDGGLVANPPIFPLLHQCAARDVIVVLLHALRRQGTPTLADEIWERLAEISFSSTFFTELQGLALAKREAERGRLSFGRLERRLRHLNVHLIHAQELMSELTAISKLDAHPSFIKTLYDAGRNQAEEWLKENFKLIGSRSSFELASCLH
jgi:NTE family protein